MSSGSDVQRDTTLCHLPSQLRFWCVAALALWLDLWSKAWVFKTLAPQEVRSFIPGVISFRRSLNDGAVFGSFTGHTPVFIVASLFALAFVFYLFVHSHRKQWTLHVALAMILAGALGNLYDRAFVQADVVAFKTTSMGRDSIIGIVTSEDDAPFVRVSSYPDGRNERRFDADDVTVRKQGVVRDFIKFVPKFPASTPKLAGRDIWPWIFNIADAVLVCGVGMLLLHTWLDRKPRRARD